MGCDSCPYPANRFADKFPPLPGVPPWAASSPAPNLHALEERAYPLQFRIERRTKSRVARRLAVGVAEFRAKASFGQGKIAPADNPLVPKQGQGVVPELAFRRRCVGLEAINPVPEDLEAGPVPNHGIKGRKQTHL